MGISVKNNQASEAASTEALRQVCAWVIQETPKRGTSLVVQWLGLCAPNAGAQV